MKSLRCVALILLFTIGCQTAQLRNATETQAATVTDLYYGQILSNIAMLSDQPAALPYFSLPDTGTNSVQLSLSMNYTLNADLLASTSTMARYLGAYVFDKQSLGITGGDTNIEQWTTKPTRDPDQLILMSYAYDSLFGRLDVEHDKVLRKVLDAKRTFTNEEMLKKAQKDTENIDDKTLRDIRIAERLKQMEADQLSLSPLALLGEQYSSRLTTGWFCVGNKCDVPKGACYVGRYGKKYAWVIPGMEVGIKDFSLVILNLSTYTSPNRQQATTPPAVAGKAAR